MCVHFLLRFYCDHLCVNYIRERIVGNAFGGDGGSGGGGYTHIHTRDPKLMLMVRDALVQVQTLCSNMPRCTYILRGVRTRRANDVNESWAPSTVLNFLSSMDTHIKHMKILGKRTNKI